VETDLRPLNLGLASAKRRTQDSGMGATRGNGNVNLDKFLKDEERLTAACDKSK